MRKGVKRDFLTAVNMQKVKHQFFLKLYLIERPSARLLSFARLCHRKRLPGCSQ